MTSHRAVTPERVKELLSSLIYTNNEDTNDSDRNTQQPKIRKSSEFKFPNPVSSERHMQTKPRDRTAFIERVNTYTSAHWLAKPALLSPLHCARYGWKNVKKDLLMCVSCHAYLSGRISTTSDQQVYVQCCQRLLNLLISGHKPLCPWINLPSPESFLSLALLSQDEAITKAKQTVREFLKLGELLPIISCQTTADLALSQKELDALVKLLMQDPDEPELTGIHHSFIDDSPLIFPDDSTLTLEQTLILLTVCGWSIREGFPNQLKCSQCNRYVGLWSCHSLHTRRVQEEESRLQEECTEDMSDSGNLTAVENTDNNQEVPLDAVDNSGSDDLITKWRASGSEDMNSVQDIVAAILEEIILSCVEETEDKSMAEDLKQQSGDVMETETSTEVSVHESAEGISNGAVSSVVLEASEEVTTQDKHDGELLSDVEGCSEDVQAIVSGIIEDILQKCCRDGSSSDTPKDAVGNAENNLALFVEDSDHAADPQKSNSMLPQLPEQVADNTNQERPTAKETAPVPANQNNVITTPEETICVSTICVINDPNNQYIDPSEMSDEVESADNESVKEEDKKESTLKATETDSNAAVSGYESPIAESDQCKAKSVKTSDISHPEGTNLNTMSAVAGLEGTNQSNILDATDFNQHSDEERAKDLVPGTSQSEGSLSAGENVDQTSVPSENMDLSEEHCTVIEAASTKMDTCEISDVCNKESDVCPKTETALGEEASGFPATPSNCEISLVEEGSVEQMEGIETEGHSPEEEKKDVSGMDEVPSLLVPDPDLCCKDEMAAEDRSMSDLELGQNLSHAAQDPDNNSSISCMPSVDGGNDRNKRRMSDDNPGPKTKKKKKNTLSYFCPVNEHKSWCPWIIKQPVSLASGSPLKQSCDSGDKPGWLLFVDLLLSKQKSAEKETSPQPRKRPTKYEVKKIQSILQKATSPVLNLKPL